jgi:hypothetical protein
MLIMVQYLLFGLVLALPYAMLSDGGWVCLIAASFLLPVALFLIQFGSNFRFGGMIVASYVLSPVLLNSFAILLQGVVEAEWASTAYEWRYDPLWIVPCLYVAIDLALYAADSRRCRRTEFSGNLFWEMTEVK